MSKTTTVPETQSQVEATDSTAILGFWAYLMTDCVLFASLFAVYAVLHNNTFGGPAGGQLFSLRYALGETLILLTSSFTCGLGMLAAYQHKLRQVRAWFAATFVLGASFLALELHEFAHLASTGNSWTRSGFLSSFFTLVGTHGLHITIGLLWIIVMMVRTRRGISRSSLRKLTMFSLFWHFLDVIWILIFTIVYLLGVLKV